MAADLHIHVLMPPCTEADLADFNSHVLGSKHFTLEREPDDAAFDRVCDTPHIWIGEVSWLKAALTQRHDTFVPDTVMIIHDAIGEDLPILDDELASKILGAFDAPNRTSYQLTGASSELRAFLQEWRGQRLFTVSW